MTFIDDVTATVKAGQAALGAVRSVAEWYGVLTPLRDAALRGDSQAYGELQRYAGDSTNPPLMAAARLHLEQVNVQRKVGTAATKVGVGLYPGQLATPALGIGLLFLLMLLARRK